MSDLLCYNAKPIDDEPPADIAICSTCGWQGDASKCKTEQDGTWEEGYYDVHLCPKCEDGGCVDDYTMSDEQHKRWQEWAKRKGVI